MSGLRRLAAGGCLGCFAAALAVAVAGLVHRPVALPVTVAAIAITVMAAWAALVGRGPRRVAAGLVAVVALIGLILFAEVAGLVRVLLIVGLVAASAALARVAFGRHRPAGTRVGPARRGVLLVNPRSGGGAAGRHDLADEAARRGVGVVMLTAGADLRSLCEAAADRGADVVGMAGGDGSQAVVADVARRRGLAYVCVPAGTRNHFALDLGLDRRDVAGALDAFGEAVERRVDLGQVGDRVFVNNVSLGVYAEIVQSDDYREAKISTAADLLPDLLGPGHEPPDLRFPTPAHGGGAAGVGAGTADVLLVSNNPYQVRSLGGFGVRPRLDGGRLGIVALRIDRAQDLPRLVALEAMGAIDRFPGFQQWNSPGLRVDSGGPLSVAIDGEALRLPPPLEFHALPAAVRVRVPLHAPGGLVTRPGILGMVPALLRMLAGRTVGCGGDARAPFP